MALSEQQRARVLDLLGFCEEPWAACLADNIEDAAIEEMRARAVLKRAGMDESGRVHVTYTVTK